MKKIKNFGFLIFAMALLFACYFVFQPSASAVSAVYQGFNPGNIISDATMSDFSSMSESAIYNFLKSKNPCNDTNISKASYYSNHTYHIENGHFVCMADESFDGESAAHIIWQAAQDYHINPKVLIVLLEKEQGLVTDTWPNFDLQYRSATGYGCPDTAACDSQYYGFRNQIRNAAELFRYILDYGSRYYPTGANYVRYNPDASCGGATINIENRATSALYQYTPYQPNGAVLDASPGVAVTCGAYGNINFYYYFKTWFGDTYGGEINGIYLPNGIYQFRTTDDLALSFGGESNGASAMITNANYYDEMQQFELIRDGKYHRFRNVKTGRMLDVYNGETSDGTKVELWDGNDGCSQKWLVQESGNGYQLVSACSNTSSMKSLDINGAATGAVGTKVQLWTTNYSNAQRWNLINTSSAVVDDGTYESKSTSGRVLTPSSEYPTDGSNMLIWEDSTSLVNRINMYRAPDGYYHLKNVKSGLYLSAYDASGADGTAVSLSVGNLNVCMQKWLVENNDNGYRIMNACSGKSLDIDGGRVGINLTKVQLWSSNSSDAQKWYLDSPDTEQIIEDGVYAIDSALGNDTRLDVNGSAAAVDGTNVGIWGRNGGDNQKFKVSFDANSGYYIIDSTFANRSLDVTSNGITGANLQVYASSNGCYQRWMIIPVEGQNYIVSSCDRNAMDVFGADGNNGANVGVWLLNGGANQRWIFDSDTEGLKGPIEDGTYIIQSKLDSNLVLDIAGGMAANGVNVGTWSKHEGGNQLFRLVSDPSTGLYSITNDSTNRSLDATGAVAANGTNLEIWSRNNSCAQSWKISQIEEGYYRISSACNTNYSLDVSGAVNTPGANVLLWGNHGNDNQKWAFKKV